MGKLNIGLFTGFFIVTTSILVSCAPPAIEADSERQADIIPSTGTTNPAMFTKIYEISPSISNRLPRLLTSNFQEVDDNGSLLIQFDESLMKEPSEVIQQPNAGDGATATENTVENEEGEDELEGNDEQGIETPSNAVSVTITPSVEVTVEVIGIVNGNPTQLDITPLRSSGQGEEPASPNTDSPSTDSPDTPDAEGESNTTFVPQNAFQQSTQDRLDFLTRVVLAEAEVTPMPYIPQNLANSVIPDQRADLNVINAASYERIKIRITNVRTNEVYERQVIPRPFGTRVKLGASLMFVNRMGVEPSTTVNDTVITDVNFAASPGVTISTIFYLRPEWLLSGVVNTVHPGVGFNVTYLSWNDGGTARDFELGLGFQASLFNDAIYGTYGWNLQAPAYNAYTGIGVNFVNLIELFN